MQQAYPQLRLLADEAIQRLSIQHRQQDGFEAHTTGKAWLTIDQRHFTQAGPCVLDSNTLWHAVLSLLEDFHTAFDQQQHAVTRRTLTNQLAVRWDPPGLHIAHQHLDLGFAQPGQQRHMGAHGLDLRQ